MRRDSVLGLTACHQHPDDARVLAGHGHGGFLLAAARDQPLNPPCPGCLLARRMVHGDRRSLDEDLTDVADYSRDRDQPGILVLRR